MSEDGGPTINCPVPYLDLVHDRHLESRLPDLLYMLDVTARCQGRVTSRYDEAGWDGGSLVADADTPELPLVPLLDESAPCVEAVLLPRYGGVDEVQVDVLCVATVEDVLEEDHIEDVLTETELLVRLVHAPQRAFVPEIGVVYLRRCVGPSSNG